MIGVFAIGANDPAPRDVSVQSGRVLYTLSRTITGPPKVFAPGIAGYMLVQMTDDTHIRMEMFPPGDEPTDFTNLGQTLTR